jgi:cytochrome b6-f complex iron-sulfur subunit
MSDPRRRDVIAGLLALAGCHPGLDDTDRTDTTETDDTAAPCDGGNVGTDAYDVCFADHPELRQVGGSAPLNLIETGPLILVRVDDATIVTLSSVCTHQACQVIWVNSRQRLVCPCHGSQFAIDGSVTAGPAGRPLATYPTTFDQQKVEIDLRGA